MRTSSGKYLAMAAAAAPLATAGPVSAGQAPQLTKPVQVTTGDVDPGRTYTTPSLAVDPANPLNVVSTLSEARTRKCGLIRSGDGGQTWKQVDSSPALAT